MNFAKWLNALLEEKNIDLNSSIDVEGPSGLNIMPLSMVVDAMKSTSGQEQAQIKNTLVKIDFHNGDVMHFISHIAKALAV